MNQQPFDLDLAFNRIRKAISPFPKAAMFELAEQGFDSPFELLIACILSIRTRDEVSLPCAQKLFELARTPVEVGQLSLEQINQAIAASTFHEAKAPQILEIARRVVTDYGGVLPCEASVLLSFPGVGPKCANLVLGIACQQAWISVDIHVHRVTNRWGYVQARSPEKTLLALATKLPTQYWVEINALLVPFGKHICTGKMPRCSTCPVVEMCQQVGIKDHR